MCIRLTGLGIQNLEQLQKFEFESELLKFEFVCELGNMGKVSDETTFYTVKIQAKKTVKPFKKLIQKQII